MATYCASAAFLIFEELLDSSDEETSNAMMDTTILCLVKRENIPKVETYTETIDKFTDYDFKNNFRIRKRTFDVILNRISHLLKPATAHGTDITPPQTQLYICLWYMSIQSSVREISNLFNISLSTVKACISRVSSALCDIKSSIIRWPSRERQEAIAASFADDRPIQGICGAIDGTHIRLAGAPRCQREYYNRKGFPSVQLQLVVDDSLLIMDSFVGWPGSTHDARVLRNSPLYINIEDGDLLAPDLFLIGDSAYPLRKWLLTPFKDFGNMTPAQRRYNRAHAAARQCVERAIGQLKGRFRRLLSIYSADMENICKLVTAACVLHNICIYEDDEINACLHEPHHINNYPQVFRDAADGQRRRNDIVQLF